jgi:hypothetical protein
MYVPKQGFMMTATVLACLSISALALGDDDGGGKGKGKGKSETATAPAGKMVIQIDLSKLPPDLAKALLKYAGGPPAAKTPPPPPVVKGKAPPPPPIAKGKAPATPMAKGSAGGKQLPPGLAQKPQGHPGRTHYILHVLGGKAPPPAKGIPPGKGSAGKKPSKGDDD